MKEFHGEEYSEDPEEVEPQHLAPNDAMSYHQVIEVCDPSHVYTGHTVKAKATYTHPITREDLENEIEIAMGDLVTSDATQLYKGDVVVAYAQALIIIGDLWLNDQQAEALEVAHAMVTWLEQAAMDLGDPEVSDIASHMSIYVTTLEGP
jgi:Ca-activated chloride channel family protein